MRRPDKPNVKMITVRMSSEERELAKELAHVGRTTVNDLIRKMILIAADARAPRDKTVQHLLDKVKTQGNGRW